MSSKLVIRLKAPSGAPRCRSAGPVILRLFAANGFSEKDFVASAFIRVVPNCDS
jgi:hypothetical protein